MQPLLSTKLCAKLLDRGIIVPAEVGDRFVIRREPSGQPHPLEIAIGLPNDSGIAAALKCRHSVHVHPDGKKATIAECLTADSGRIFIFLLALHGETA
jgi:hypothetical protein